MDTKQRLENLPDELLKQKRFFRVGCFNSEGVFKQKNPVDKWNNPDNQKLYTDLHFTDSRQLAGFDIVGHGSRADYLVADFDHVLNDDGDFVNEEIADWYGALMVTGTYCEKSISGHGLHIVFKPAEGEFPPLSAGSAATLKYGDAKIELFYKPGGRYFLLTGDVYDTAPKMPISTDCSVIHDMLNEIAGREYTLPNTQNQNADISRVDVETARELLNYIPCPKNGENYSLWLNVGFALHFNGNPFEDWLNWSRTAEPDVSEKELLAKWNSFNKNFTGKRITIATVISLAIQNGYNPPPPMTEELKAAIDYLNSFNQDNISLEICQSPKTIRACTVCLIGRYADVVKSFKENMHAILQDEKEYGKSKAELDRKVQKMERHLRFTRLKQLKAQSPCHKRDAEMIGHLKALAKWQFVKNTGEYKVSPIIQNGDLFFEYDPNIDGLFGYNEFADKIQYLRPASWYHQKQWRDADDKVLQNYLRRTYPEFHSAELINNLVDEYARRHKFHPVKQFLESLQWDGVSRAEELFIKHLGVDDSEYSRIITRTWLLAAVARIYNPGCNFQMALVLQGKQGIGKSYLFETLGGEWAIKLTSSLDDPHAIDDIQEAWIVEIEELAAARKAEINAVKSFISRSKDTARLAYEHRSADLPRHCVFCITVNDNQFLRDQTGNRRFKILACRNDMYRTGAEFNSDTAAQIWAEVMIWYREIFANGFDEKKLELSYEINIQAEQIARQYLAVDETAEEIYSFVETPIPPQVFWQLMTRAERTKFFETNSITFSENELLTRYEKLPAKWKKRLDEKEFREKIDAARSNYEVVVRGTELRQTICATELFHECFKGKKTLIKINEALPPLEGWTPIGRQQQKDRYYPDQTLAYKRIEKPEPPDDSTTTNPDGFSDFFTGEVISDSSVPFA